MTETIAFDKFRYWLISLDLLEKRPNIEKWEENRFESGLFLHRTDGSVCMFKSLPILDNKTKRNGFSAIYVDVLTSFGNKLILTFGNLNANSASKLSIAKMDYFKNLQKDLIMNLQSSELFEDENKSIFFQDMGRPFPIIRAPMVLYMEPLENDLFSNSNNGVSIDTIRNVIQMLHSHENLWSVINGYVLSTFLYAPYPWNGLIFLNTNKIAEDDTNIHLPSFVYYLLEQLACYHWLAYRENQLFGSDLLNLNPQNLISNTTLKLVSRAHRQVLSSLGQFNDYHITLMDELPSFKNLNISFLRYLKTVKIVEPNAKMFRGPSTIERLTNANSESLTSIEQHIEKLTIKAQMLSSYSRDMLNIQISTINLRLQWLLAFLTIVLAFLTFILAAENPSVQKILTMLWDTLK